jgi:hypothetical protein
MPCHVDSLPAKDHAFSFKPHSLLKGGATTQLDLASRTDDAVPWKTDGAAKSRRHLASASTEACRAGNCSIGGNHASWHLANGR